MSGQSDLSLRLAADIAELRGLLQANANDVANIRVDVAKIGEQTSGLRAEMADIRRDMVTRPRFRPVEVIAYGFAGIVLSSFAYALVTMVLRSTQGP